MPDVRQSGMADAVPHCWMEMEGPFCWPERLGHDHTGAGSSSSPVPGGRLKD